MIPGTEWREAHGQQILYLGEIDVGRVRETDRLRPGPGWIFNLNAAQSHWHSAYTLAQAKQEVENRLLDWLQKAGLR